MNKRSLADPNMISRIKHDAFAGVSPVARGRVHLTVDRTIVPANHIYHLVDRVITAPPRDSVLVFVDDLPGANFAHPCRYRFHDPATSHLVSEHAAAFPPEISDKEASLELFHAPLARPRLAPSPVLERVDWRSILGVSKYRPLRTEDRYAILFTSQISNVRHVDDCELLWRTLVDVYGFAEDHIYVLCYDGTIGATDAPAGGLTTWAGDNSAFRMKVWSSATRANFQAAIDAVGERLKSPDLLFIHTNNHGSPSGLCIDNSSVLTPADFGTMLSGLPKFGSLVVMMEQCYSGAFKTPTLDKATSSQTVFSSAAPADNVSWGGAYFDAFAEPFFEALRGSTAYGAALASQPDTNLDAMVSIWEAHQYAKKNDATADAPQYGDRPEGCGKKVWLGVPPREDLLAALRHYLERYKHLPIPPIPPDPPWEIPHDLRGLAGLLRTVGPIGHGG